jgi:hypothetical protein
MANRPRTNDEQRPGGKPKAPEDRCEGGGGWGPVGTRERLSDHWHIQLSGITATSDRFAAGNELHDPPLIHPSIHRSTSPATRHTTLYCRPRLGNDHTVMTTVFLLRVFRNRNREIERRATGRRLRTRHVIAVCLTFAFLTLFLIQTPRGDRDSEEEGSEERSPRLYERPSRPGLDNTVDRDIARFYFVCRLLHERVEGQEVKQHNGAPRFPDT